MKRLLSVIVLIALCICGAVAIFLLGDDGGDAVATPDKSRPAPSFDELHQNFASMTEVQWNNYKDDVKGAYVEELSGTVSDVDEMLGSYTIILYHNDDPNSRIRIPVSEETALIYERGQVLTVSGNIALVLSDEIFGGIALSMDEGTIITTK